MLDRDDYFGIQIVPIYNLIAPEKEDEFQSFYFIVKDWNDQIVFKSKIAKTKFKYEEKNDNIPKEYNFFLDRNSLISECKIECSKWLEENHPDWRDLNKYASDLFNN